MRLQDFAPVRTFTSAKLVDNSLLNRMGLQVGRAVAARALYKLRRTPAPPDLRDELTKLRGDGMLRIDNFLDEATFNAVKAECDRVLELNDSRIIRRQHGATRYGTARVSEFGPEEMGETQQFFRMPIVRQLLEGAERTRIQGDVKHCVLEHVVQGDSGEIDPETALHSDIFFNTHKIWLYLTDVTPENAPLTYVPGSHGMGVEQLRHIYQHSCAPAEQSRRIVKEEMEARGLKELVLTCPANTLVVANVCGYHRRSVGSPGAERMALHCSIRRQPFFGFLDKVVERMGQKQE